MYIRVHPCPKSVLERSEREIKNASRRAAEVAERKINYKGFAQELKKVFHTLYLISLSEIKTPQRLCALERSGREKVFL